MDGFVADLSLLAEVADCVRAGGVALIPTDTVYGLAVSPLRDDAVDRLFAMKMRPRTVNLPVMVASVSQIKDLGVEIGDAAKALMESRHFPGPLTLALGFRKYGDRPDWLRGRLEVAVRMPDERALLSLLADVGPLLVTSANAHAQSPQESVSAVLESLHGSPDVAVDGGARSTVSSTLVNCRLRPAVVERVGAIPFAEIEKVCECVLGS